MSDQIITLLITIFSSYGFFIFSYQLWRCALGLFRRKNKRKLSGEKNG